MWSGAAMRTTSPRTPSVSMRSPMRMGCSMRMDEAGDEVADDVLETEANTNAERASEDNQGAEIDAEGLEADKEAAEHE